MGPVRPLRRLPDTDHSLSRFLLSPARLARLYFRRPGALGMGLGGVPMLPAEFDRAAKASLMAGGRGPWGTYVREALLPSIAIAVLFEATMIALAAGGVVPGYWAARAFLVALSWGAFCGLAGVAMANRLDRSPDWHKELSEALSHVRSRVGNKMPQVLLDVSSYSMDKDAGAAGAVSLVARNLGGLDTVGMIRLGMALGAGRAAARHIEMDGDTSELLGRVAEALRDEEANWDPTTLRLSVMRGLEAGPRLLSGSAG